MPLITLFFIHPVLPNVVLSEKLVGDVVEVVVVEVTVDGRAVVEEDVDGTAAWNIVIILNACSYCLSKRS